MARKIVPKRKQIFISRPFLELEYGIVTTVLCCVCQYMGTAMDFHPLGRQSRVAHEQGVNKLNARCPRCRAVAEFNLGRSIWNLLMAGES